MGTHASDTHTMCREIYYVHLKSGSNAICKDTLCQALGGCRQFAAAINSADKHKSTER